MANSCLINAMIKATVSANLKNSSLIQDRDLALEVYLCFPESDLDCSDSQPITTGGKETLNFESGEGHIFSDSYNISILLVFYFFFCLSSDGFFGLFIDKSKCNLLTLIHVALRNPPSLLSIEIIKKFIFLYIRARNLYSRALRNSRLKQKPLLAHMAYHLILSSQFYGSSVQCTKMTIGLEYEVLLKKRLAENNIPFSDEHKLRHQGFDKTPDVKLDIPIGVDGRVINWIESKALFADEKLHQQYLKDQLWPYWNRFGPGMVIYWFGYESSIRKNTSSSNAARILVRHDFPEKCLVLTPDLILNKR
nr:EOG090X0A0V [Artemia franciscana]